MAVKMTMTVSNARARGNRGFKRGVRHELMKLNKNHNTFKQLSITYQLPSPSQGIASSASYSRENLGVPTPVSGSQPCAAKNPTPSSTEHPILLPSTTSLK